MVDVDVLADGRNCEQVGDEPDDANGAVDVGLLLDVLVVPGGHAEAHLLDLVLAGQLAAGVEVEALVDVAPGLQLEVQLVPDVREVAGHVGEDDGHPHHDVDVALVELEETRQRLHAPLLLVQLHAAGLVVRDLREGPEHVEDEVLVGREEFDDPRPGLQAVAVQEDAVGFLLDCEVAEAGGELDEDGSSGAGKVLVGPDAQVAV